MEFSNLIKFQVIFMKAVFLKFEKIKNLLTASSLNNLLLVGDCWLRVIAPNLGDSSFGGDIEGKILVHMFPNNRNRNEAY